MLLAGDEFGRTQKGNNNAYCQDNEITWLDWRMAASPAGAALAGFVARLGAIRRAHPVLRSPVFLHGRVMPAPGIADIAWFDERGGTLSAEAWNDPGQRTLVLRRAVTVPEGRVAILTLLLNPTDEPKQFSLPAPHLPTRVLLDTAVSDTDEHDGAGSEQSVAAHSVVLLHATCEPGGQ
jgi:isoamylase